MKTWLLLLVPILWVQEVTAAEYLFKRKDASLVFACGGQASLYKAEVQYRSYGHYTVKGPYIKGVVAAPNALEAAVLACGEGRSDSFKDVAGLKSYKDP